MRNITRRRFGEILLKKSMIPAIGLQVALNASCAHAQDRPVEPDSWLKEWRRTEIKDFPGVLDLRRFRDPMYVLLSEVVWTPPVNKPELQAVRVPKGFVTDFASVPRPFWSLFRPDGNYAFAAVLHDFLYWEQDRPRSSADAVFRSAMTDLKITDSQATALYQAVNQFGQTAWNQNTSAKAAGERRVLARLPDRSDITWAEWKSRADVF